MLNFADRLKKYRERLGLSRKATAEKLGMTAQAYGLYELGKRQPDLEKLLAISNVLAVSVDELLGNTVDRYAEICAVLADYGLKVEKMTASKTENTSHYKISHTNDNDSFIVFSSKENITIFDKTEDEFCTIVESAIEKARKDSLSREKILVSGELEEASVVSSIKCSVKGIKDDLTKQMLKEQFYEMK